MVDPVSALAELLGGIAGGIVFVSTLPALAEAWERRTRHGTVPRLSTTTRRPRQGRGERSSRLIMAIGNGFLVASSLITGPLTLTACAALVMTMNILIWVLMGYRRGM